MRHRWVRDKDHMQAGTGSAVCRGRGVATECADEIRLVVWSIIKLNIVVSTVNLQVKCSECVIDSVASCSLNGPAAAFAVGISIGIVGALQDTPAAIGNDHSLADLIICCNKTSCPNRLVSSQFDKEAFPGGLNWCRNQIATKFSQRHGIGTVAIIHRKVVIHAVCAGLQVEVTELKLYLTARVGLQEPVAFSIGVVGQGVVRGGKTASGCSQGSTTT